LHGPHLNKTSLLRSFDNYWRWCIRDDNDRQFVVQKTDEVRDGMSWTTDEYRQWIEARAAADCEATRTTLAEGEEESDEAELIATTSPTEQKEPVQEQAQDVRVAPDIEGLVAPLATNDNADSVEENKVEERKVEEKKVEEKNVEEEKDVEEQNAEEKVVAEDNAKEKVVQKEEVKEEDKVADKGVEEKNAATP
jgi:hypothetical protein